MRLIDYKEIRKLFNKEYKEAVQLIHNGDIRLDTVNEGFRRADKVILKLPDVDAVEVVRCKDCKYHGEDETGYWCNRMFNSHKTVEDNFCKFGAKMIRSKNND